MSSSIVSGKWFCRVCACMALAQLALAVDSFASSPSDDCSTGVCCQDSSDCGGEQMLLQKTQTRLSSVAGHSEQQSKSFVVDPSFKAAKVPLSEEGYKAIAKLKNEREMAVFVKRVADELGYEIVDEGSLNGVVPYYSGKKATQSFVALTSELTRTSKQGKGWAKKPLHKRSVPIKTDPADQILLQESQKVVPKKPTTSLMDSGKMTAKGVPLNEDGYKTIAKLKNDPEMAVFVKRVADELGYEIVSEGSLNGVVPYYSGKKATQSFAALTSELTRTSKQGKGWAKKPLHKKSVPIKATPSDQILLQESQRIVSKKPQASLVESGSMAAEGVPLNEEGYKAIAKLKNEREMAVFVKRVADELGYEIVDEGSLNGVVPYYSGKKATQSFVALTSEFSRASKQGKGWAKKASTHKKHAASAH